MTTIRNFEEILAWKKAHALTINMYHLFGESRDYALKDQLLRACISIMNNIAEGFERKSDKEFKYFLKVSKGSCAEVRSMMILTKDLKKMTQDDFDANYELSVEVSKLIMGLMNTLKC